MLNLIIIQSENICHALKRICQHITESADGKKHWFVYLCS